jgi:hypothetical protein
VGRIVELDIGGAVKLEFEEGQKWYPLGEVLRVPEWERGIQRGGAGERKRGGNKQGGKEWDGAKGLSLASKKKKFCMCFSVLKVT